MIDVNQYLKGASPYNNAYALKYNDDGDYSLEAKPPVVPESSNDIQHTVKDGETLQNIAFRYYGDSGKWYIIAEANKILNPFKELEMGTLIRIPTYGS
jgi:nucleoid-associated protein YgaU